MNHVKAHQCQRYIDIIVNQQFVLITFATAYLPCFETERASMVFTKYKTSLMQTRKVLCV